MKRSLLLSFGAWALAGLSMGQTLTMPPHGSTFTGFTRGYYFEAPVDMTITGVQVLLPTGSTNGFQNFAIIRFDNAVPPPVFSATTNAFTQLVTGFDLPQNAFQPVSVAVSAGDLIGVYGNTTATVGATSGTNSYSANSPQTGTIAGFTVDLLRSGFQTHLGSATSPGGMMDVFASNSDQITRIELTYTVGGGNTFCDPANNNSTGAPVALSGTFSGGGGSGLHLEATGGPPSEFGYFLIGTAAETANPIPISNGLLCLSVTGGNGFGRYNVLGGTLNSIGSFDGSGVFQNLAGTSTVGSGFDVPSLVPMPGGMTIMAGDTWHFQMWYRDTPAGAGVSNLSNGLSVDF